VSDNDDGAAEPRHRKNGRATKRGTGVPGRRVLDDPSTNAEGTIPPGSYPIADLAAMSPSAAAMLLHRARLESEAGVTGRDHIVITCDSETGDLSFNGPFSTGLEALTMAHQFVEKYRGLTPRWDFTISVQPVVRG
jgi:hypothetical protein